MPGPDTAELQKTRVISQPRHLESISTQGGRIIFAPRPDGDFDATKTGRGGGNENAYIDFKNAQILLPQFRTALPRIAELYPEPQKSIVDSADEHLIIPGEKRTDDFRKKWLQPLGANSAPILYLNEDEIKKETITDQVAKGNLLIANGNITAEFPVHDRVFHLFGALAEPEELFGALKYLAQQVPDLAKAHPEAAYTVRKGIAQALDQSTNIVNIPGASLYLPQLDVLNSLVRATKTYSGATQDSTGTTPNDFVRSVLKEKGFDVIESINELGCIREPISTEGGLSFVSYITRNATGLVVPREHELLIDYVPKLVDHLKSAA